MSTLEDLRTQGAALDVIEDVEARAYQTELAATKLALSDGDPGDLSPGESARVRLLVGMMRVVRARRAFDEQAAAAAVADVADIRDPLVDHMRALSLMIGGTERDLRQARASAQRAASELPRNPGVQHTVAWTSLEELLLTDDTNQAKVRDALAVADTAVSLLSAIPEDEQYLMYRGRFYYTRSQLARLAGDWQLARSDIKEALAKEVASSATRRPPDYERRITEYIIERRFIDVDRAAVAVQRRVERSEQTILGAVGFVALIIGLITTAVNVVGARTYSWWQAILILAAMGVVLIVTILVGAGLMRLGARARRV